MTDERIMLTRLLAALGYDSHLTDKAFNQALERAEILSRVQTALQSAKPEQSGALFIYGMTSEKDDMGLPMYLYVCPTFGLDGFAVYKQIQPYTAPGY